MFRALERRRATALVVACLLLVLLVRTAWVADQAYITFRTIDNFLQGLGLRWNPLERVQAFTHPLWLLLVAAGYAVTGEPYYTTLALSIGVSVAAVVLLVDRIARETAAAIGAAAVLLLSKSFVDYSTSGLENPLTHVLLALFFVNWFDDRAETRLSRMAWLAGLLAVTRTSTELLVTPALITAATRDRRMVSAGQLLPAVAPFLIWSSFATIYYGFPAPNSTYAWASGVTSSLAEMRGGMVYLLDSINLDPITGAAIVVVVGLAAVGWLSDVRPIATGIVAYLIVVFATGGDSMSGRLLSAPLFCAAIAISRADFSKIETTVRLQLLALTIGFGFMALHPTLMSGAPSATASLFNASTGIGDERLLTFPASGLRSVVRGTPPNELAMRQGHAARDARRPVVTSSGDLIVAAFFSGPTVHILDATGNADPLLARLSPNPSSYPGQAVRELPDGYEDAVISGSEHLTNPTLAMYHEQLTLITRGPIWSISRWLAILRMNLTHRGGLQALRVG